jgi:hypothetical protein
MLFTATDIPPPSPSPTSSPTATIIQQWGLEQLGSLNVSLPNGTWPLGYPKDKSALLVPSECCFIANMLYLQALRLLHAVN